MTMETLPCASVTAHGVIGCPYTYIVTIACQLDPGIYRFRG